MSSQLRVRVAVFPAERLERLSTPFAGGANAVRRGEGGEKIYIYGFYPGVLSQLHFLITYFIL